MYPPSQSQETCTREQPKSEKKRVLAQRQRALAAKRRTDGKPDCCQQIQSDHSGLGITRTHDEPSVIHGKYSHDQSDGDEKNRRGICYNGRIWGMVFREAREMRCFLAVWWRACVRRTEDIPVSFDELSRDGHKPIRKR